MVTEYNKLYVLRNPENNKVVLTYWASSQKHKAIFPTRQGTENVNRKWLNNFYIVEEL